MDWPLKFGIFLAPFHPVGQNPTLALERDLELICRLDELGFDEAWIGEHHSAGYEIIASPELFMAVAAERTRNIKLGTGVSSLPYHHPLILADRMVLLDHLTRGRVMFGVGPGALPSDAFMMGIDTSRQREMMEECARGDRGAAHQRRAGQHADRLVHAQATPVSSCGRTRIRTSRSPWPRRCRRRVRVSPASSGFNLLSIGATSAGGFDVLGSHWTVMEERAAEFGTTADRRGWRLVGPMHIAETEEQARKDVEFGLPSGWTTSSASPRCRSRPKATRPPSRWSTR